MLILGIHAAKRPRRSGRGEVAEAKRALLGASAADEFWAGVDLVLPERREVRAQGPHR